ncbi:hypothetical protein N018_04130 [Pseudomonas syringae CC1557]|uniref:Uncharacterized protein n=1 Tax=Pseudomonas syringae CC1557 TaxID=1357279 RepID=W0N2J5_PSESX|nr:hypothetical protein N018_04130 [Pseudomonas syringae CC1557]
MRTVSAEKRFIAEKEVIEGGKGLISIESTFFEH